MFVRVVSRHLDPELKFISEEETIECRRVSLQKFEDNIDILLLVYEDGMTESFEVDKETDEIYLMNDRGQPIDSYRWASGKLASSELASGEQNPTRQVVDIDRVAASLARVGELANRAAEHASSVERMDSEAEWEQVRAELLEELGVDIKVFDEDPRAAG